jgi:aryl-alcohol dehydrogenase-like predicted oxidoreductase
VKYSLLDRHPERSGLADVCKKLGVTLIAYSPLEKGILTGKYTSENRPQGFLPWRYNKAYLDKIDPIITNLCEIGEAHGSKTTAQVALNWLICKGAVPIPGVRNPQQTQDNAGALEWQLSTEEVNRLDNISNEVFH